MNNDIFYVEHLTQELNSYELKMFRAQHDETQLTNYLKKYAKKHEAESINKTYLVRYTATRQLAAWFSLKAATLPYNENDDSFLTPAVELTHFAVDERFKTSETEKSLTRTGEYIFWKFILPIVKDGAQKIACKDLFIFAINHPHLVKYYKQNLGFKEIKGIDDKQFFSYAKPEYDSGCKFLYFPLA